MDTGTQTARCPKGTPPKRDAPHSRECSCSGATAHRSAEYRRGGCVAGARGAEAHAVGRPLHSSAMGFATGSATWLAASLLCGPRPLSPTSLCTACGAGSLVSAVDSCLMLMLVRRPSCVALLDGFALNPLGMLSSRACSPRRCCAYNSSPIGTDGHADRTPHSFATGPHEWRHSRRAGKGGKGASSRTCASLRRA